MRINPDWMNLPTPRPELPNPDAQDVTSSWWPPADFVPKSPKTTAGGHVRSAYLDDFCGTGPKPWPGPGPRPWAGVEFVGLDFLMVKNPTI